MKKDGVVTKLSSFNEAYVNEHEIAETEHFTFTDKDGVEIDGWVLYPADFDKEKKRLEKDMAAAQANIASRKARLAQENFIKNAPQEQIDKTKAELAAAETLLAQAQAALADLA